MCSTRRPSPLLYSTPVSHVQKPYHDHKRGAVQCGVSQVRSARTSKGSPSNVSPVALTELRSARTESTESTESTQRKARTESNTRTRDTPERTRVPKHTHDVVCDEHAITLHRTTGLGWVVRLCMCAQAKTHSRYTKAQTTCSLIPHTARNQHQQHI